MITEEKKLRIPTNPQKLDSSMNLRKWQFCPEKRCYSCNRNLEEISKEDEVVTGCGYCNSSFLD